MSASQSHASQRIQETDTSLSGTAMLTLGLATNNYGEHDYSQSLWAKNDKKLRYLAIQGQFSNKSNYFMGNGVNPSLYLGIKNKDLGNRMGRSVLKYSPFLELSSKGSFLGAGFQLNSKSSFSAVAFKGNNPEEEYLLIKRPESSGLLVEYKKNFRDTQFSLQTGLLTEPKGFLGNSVSGAYGNLDNSDTLFSGLQIFHESDNFYTTGSIFYGKTDTNFKEQGLISSLDNFKTSSFIVGLFSKKGFGRYDSFGLQIEQPLRLEEGRMDISVPVGRTKYREVLFQDYSMDIAPSGRELDLKLIHNWPFSSGIISSRIGFIKDAQNIDQNKSNSFRSLWFSDEKDAITIEVGEDPSKRIENFLDVTESRDRFSLIDKASFSKVEFVPRTRKDFEQIIIFPENLTRLYEIASLVRFNYGLEYEIFSFTSDFNQKIDNNEISLHNITLIDHSYENKYGFDLPKSRSFCLGFDAMLLSFAIANNIKGEIRGLLGIYEINENELISRSYLN